MRIKNYFSMKSTANILVVSDFATDAELVQGLLQRDYDNTAISTEPSMFVDDFKRVRPNILILAFNLLEKTERYYEKLNLFSGDIPHLAITLCNQHEIRRTFRLCRNGLFEDYVIFWPLMHDSPRLSFAIHKALRVLNTAQQQKETHESVEITSLGGLASPAEVGSITQEAQKDSQGLSESPGILNAEDSQVQSTLLVVDDDEYQRKLLNAVLGTANYKLIFAASGMEALDVLNRSSVDLILMDFLMPEMDGLETMRRIKANPRIANIPVIMVTGKSEKNVFVDSFKTGATNFVVKPFERETLLAKIATAISATT